jgi:hypothetical protein
MKTITLQAADIIEKICSRLDGIKPKSSWGETALFYNPDKQLPNGVYFCTIKEKDGANDKASRLDREGVCRVAIGLPPTSYERLFGGKPARPAKGCIVSTGHDFTQINTLMPHPIYAWMSWAQILSPSQEKFDDIFPHIIEAHHSAIVKFNKKIASQKK